MPKERVIEFKQLHQEDLRALATTAGPCLTILADMPRKENALKEIRLHLRTALQEAEQKLQNYKIEAGTIQKMLEPLRAWADDPDEIAGRGASLLILRTPESLQVFSLPRAAQEICAVGDRFYITPVLKLLQEEREFYILALSQKHVRLLRCTDHSSEEAPLPPSLATDLDQFLQTDKPDHNLKNRHAAMVSGGNNGGVMFGTGPDDLAAQGQLHDFFRAIDRSITHEVLKDSKAPLIVAAVEYELAMYQKVNSYAHMIPEGVHGSPDGLKGGEMHKRALELLNASADQPAENALALFEKSGPERSSSNIREVVKAAYDGRILHLFLAEGASHMGNFDEITRKVHDHEAHPQSTDEDLLNAAAVQTISHAGNVFVLPKEKMPGQAEVAAVFRY
jgi:hypothetical protein